ncbi:MAG: hypothetical protein ACXAB9_15845 [Candidatus Thorarchaeota archaeon]|jgi:hypothetical protein
MAHTPELLATKEILCDSDNKPVCLALCSADGNEGKHCSQQAGAGTDHNTLGRCKDHSGRITPPVSLGRYSGVTTGRLNDLYNSYRQDPDMLDLTPELQLLRAITSNFLEYYADVNTAAPEHRADLKMILALLEQVSKQVERIQRIDAEQTLTVAIAKLIMVRAITIAEEFVPSIMMDQFVSTWEREVIAPISLYPQMLEAKPE